MTRSPLRSWPLLAAVLLLLVSGCSHSYDKQVMVSPRSWPAAAEVRVFSGNPPEPFEVVGLLQSIRHGSELPVAAVLGALVDQAKRNGCNALSQIRIDVGANGQFAHGFAACLRLLAPDASAGGRRWRDLSNGAQDAD